MSKSYRLGLILYTLAAVALVAMLFGGCNFQPPATEQPKEDGPTMVGFYPSPYDALTEGTVACNDLLMAFKGESYVMSNDSNTVSSYMSPCQLEFMSGQSKDLRPLVAKLTSSSTQDELRLTATQMTSEDGHTLIQLRNEKMNIDVFLRTKAPEMLPRAKGFDGSYDRKKLTMPVPDSVDQIAQKLIADGYKFNNAQAGQLQFETGSLEAISGYGTAAIMFDQATAK
jgi:hypothetical protein